MTTIFRVRVEAVEGPRATLKVDHVYGWDWASILVTSRTLALHLLWEPLLGYIRQHIPLPDGNTISWEDADALALTLPLGEELTDKDLTDEPWNRANVDRFISCVGVIDRRHHNEMWNDTNDYRWSYPREKTRAELDTAKATYLIGVTDRRWLAHLTPGMEWNSTAYDHDEKITADPAWRTATVLSLAQEMDESGDFSAMPILADALQDSGCEHDGILGHCRGHGPHVRGCWALDLLLRSRFDPNTVVAENIQKLEVVIRSLDGREHPTPDATSTDRESIDTVVAAVRSAQEVTEDWEVALGLLRFTRRRDLPGELWFFPHLDPEWYGFRACGKNYKVRRDAFSTALGRLGVVLPAG